MFQPLEWFIGLRYLRSRRWRALVSFRTAASLIGLALGVTALIVILSILNGLETETRTRLLVLSAHATVSAPEGFADWRELEGRFEAVPGVAAVTPYVRLEGMLAAGASLRPAIVRGILPAEEGAASDLAQLIARGALDNLQPGAQRMLLGRVLASNLGVDTGDAVLKVGVGDKITLVLAEQNVTPAGALPRWRSFTVSGVFDAGMYEYDRGLVFTSFEDAARLFRTDGEATGLRLAIADLYSARDVAMEAGRQLANEIGADLAIDDWTSLHATFFRSIQIQKSMMFVILSLVIAVAAFNIVSTLMMVVRDKRGDIAILRSFGSTQRSIMALFASQGTFIGVIGTLLGVLLALFISWQLGNIVTLLQGWLGVDLLSAEVYYLEDLPTQVRPLEVLQIGGIALALAIAATFYPALSAARQPPAEALRYE